jgi:5-methylcytosine-specific restriction protein B
MTDAEKVRDHARSRYVIPARNRKEVRFPICAGNVVNELHMSGKTPNVCQALKGPKFLAANNLRLVDISGPKSGLSTTVVYTYEFVDGLPSPTQEEEPWTRLRGALKDVFANLGGGEAYLRAERENFYSPEEDK